MRPRAHVAKLMQIVPQVEEISSNLTDLQHQYTVRHFRARDLFGAHIRSEMGNFLHACEGDIVCESVNAKIPYFNAPIYLENKVRTAV